MITVRTRHLLTACLRQGPEAATAFAAWMQEVGRGEVHPSELRLIPLLHASLHCSGVDDPMLRRLSGMAKHVWLSGEVRLRQAMAAVGTLQQAGIPVTAIKGLAFVARWPDAAHARPKGDFDVLVAPQHVPEALALLQSQGWSPLVPARLLASGDLQRSHALGLQHGGLGLHATSLDLHWRPTELVGDPAHAAGVLRRAEAACVGSQPVMVTSLPDHLFILLAHALLELRLPRRDWVVEAATVLRLAGAAFDWDAYGRLVRRHRIQAWSRAALALVNGVAGGTAPSASASLAPMQRWEIEARRGPAPGNAGQGFIRAWSDVRRSGRPLHHSALVGLALAPKPETQVLGLSTFKGVLRDGSAAGARPVAGVLDLAQHSLDGSPLPGWGFPEVGGRWTVGPVAWLALALPAHAPDRVPLRLRLEPYLPPASPRLRLHIWAGGEQGAWTLADTQAVEITLDAMPIPWGSAKVAPVRIYVERAQPLPPCGPEQEQRDLGVLLRRIDLGLPDDLPVMTPPLCLDGPGADRAAWSGWGQPEAWGRWTVGGEARLLLRRPGTPGPGRLRLEVTIVFGPGGYTEQTLDVWVDGRHATTAIMSGTALPHALEVPVAGGDGLLDVRLRIAQPTAPAAIGHGEDQRLLGVMLQRVSWTAA